MVYNWFLAKSIKYNTNSIDKNKTANRNNEPWTYTRPLNIEYVMNTFDGSDYNA